MKLKLRGIFAAALAFCLALSLYIPVRALDTDLEPEPEAEALEDPALTEEPVETAETEKAEDEGNPQEISRETVIDVSVPSSGQFVINPYHLPIGSMEDTSQIVHSPQAICNNTDSPVTVDVSVAGTVSPESEAVFVSGPPVEREKEVFLYTEFQNDPDLWSETYTGEYNQLVVSEVVTYGENVLTLDAGGEGYFRFFGLMSEGSFWTETDTFGAVLVFTFFAVPVEDEAAAPEEEWEALGPAEDERLEPEETEGPAEPAKDERLEPEEAEGPAEPAEDERLEPEEAEGPAEPAEDERLEPEEAEGPAEPAEEVTEAPEEAEGPAEPAEEVTEAPEEAEGPAESAEEVTKAPEETEGPAEPAEEVTKAPEEAEGPAEPVEEVTKAPEEVEGPAEPVEEVTKAPEEAEGPAVPVEEETGEPSPVLD